MNDMRKKTYCITAWVITGFVVLYAAFFSYCTGFEKLAFSASNNDTYEVSPSMMYGATLDDTHYESYYSVEPGKENINYLKITTDELEPGETNIGFSGGYINENGAFIGTYSIDEQQLEDGVNFYSIDEWDYPYIQIVVDGQHQPVIKDIQFCESDFAIPPKSVFTVLTIALIAYLLLSAATYIIIKLGTKKRDKAYGSAFGNAEIRLFTDTKSGFLRHHTYDRFEEVARVTVLFLIITNSMLLVMHVGGKKYIADFRSYLLIQISLILVLSLLLFDRHHQRKEVYFIDRYALLIAGILALYTLASDILVDKTFRFSGIGLYAALLIFGLSWNSKKNNSTFIRDYEIAVHAFFVLLLILTILKRDTYPDGRYAGPIQNPSIYALYLSGIWAVLLGAFESHLICGVKNKQSVLIALELMITLALAVMAQSLTPLVAMTTISFLLLFRIASKKKGISYALKLFAAFVGIGLAGAVCLLLIIRTSDMEVNTRLLAKFQSASISTFLSGRDYYWRAHLRKMNLFGHSQKPVLWGMKVNPHNALIGMMYMYGVPCVIPYILMFMMAIEKSYRYANRYTPCAAIPLYSIISFVIMGIADNVEQPLVWLPTISCYLLMAPILMMPVEEIERPKIDFCKEKTDE